MAMTADQYDELATQLVKQANALGRANAPTAAVQQLQNQAAEYRQKAADMRASTWEKAAKAGGTAVGQGVGAGVSQAGQSVGTGIAVGSYLISATVIATVIGVPAALGTGYAIYKTGLLRKLL